MAMFDRIAGSVVDGKYRVGQQLGAGGMGGVFLATHVGTGRSVAIKLIVPEFATDPMFVERFKREARAAGRLRHPNIVDVTDFGFAQVGGEQLAYLVMEYLDGCSLVDVLREDPQLPLDWVVDFFDQLALAIDEAHRQGIVHRDLKPANIWLEPNRRGGYTVKVLDFGLAKVGEPAAGPSPGPLDALSGDEPIRAQFAPTVTGTLPMATYPTASDHTLVYHPPVLEPARDAHDEDGERRTPENDSPKLSAAITMPQHPAVDTAPQGGTQLTRAGTLMGTPPYMSPEQCKGEVAGPASDIYSLGVIVYEMLSGRPPFEGEFMALLFKHVSEAPEPLSDRAPEIPVPVGDVVMTALAKDPASRFASAELFAAALRAKSESWRVLLGRAAVVGTEHYPLFLGIVFVAGAPFLCVNVLQVLNVALRESAVISNVAGGVAAFPLLVLGLIAGFFTSVVSKSMAATVLAQLLLAPLRKAKVRVAASVLKRHLGRIALGALRVSSVVMGLFALGLLTGGFAFYFLTTALGSVPEPWVGPAAAGVSSVVLAVASVLLVRLGFRKWIDFQVFPIVLLVENRGVRDAVKRSRELSLRSRRDVRAVATVSIVPLAVSSTLLSMTFKLFELAGDSTAAKIVELVVSTTILLFTHPYIAVLTGLLYLKLRQTEGESIEEVLDQQFVDEELPRSQWQQRLSGSPTRRVSHHSRADTDATQ
jgi:serine/threonine protein kinase